MISEFVLYFHVFLAIAENFAQKNLCFQERSKMGDGDKTVQPTGRARGRARGRPRTAEELAAMRRPGETTTTPATTAQG